MEKENIISKKVRIYPNKQQIEMFNQCFRAHRYIYNKALEFHNKSKIISSITIRNNILTKLKDHKKDSKEYWLKNIPYDTQDGAIRLLSKNLKTNLKLAKTKKIKKFKMKFLSKKRNNDMFIICKKAIDGNLKIFKRRLKENSKLKIKNKDYKWLETNIFNLKNLKKLPCDCIITRNKASQYYLIIPHKIKLKIDNTIKHNNIVALDPGIRTFQTFYSLNSCGKLGDGICNKINKINNKIDALQSIMEKAKKEKINNKRLYSKQRYRLRKRCNKLRIKVQNIICDLHWKSASYLTKNFDVILIPSFETKRMAIKKKRAINNKSTRNLLNLSHFMFKMRLKYLGEKYGSTVIECTEEFTSKTCGNCGKLNNNLGGSKIFNCSECKISIDRDINGARNILIKSLNKIGIDTVL